MHGQEAILKSLSRVAPEKNREKEESKIGEVNLRDGGRKETRSRWNGLNIGKL